MVLRGPEARPIIRSRATGADPRPLWNGNPRVRPARGSLPTATKPRRKHPSPAPEPAPAPNASATEPRQPAPVHKPNRWASWLLAGAALSAAAAALVDLCSHEDIGARRRTRAEPRPSNPSLPKRRTRPRPRTGRPGDVTASDSVGGDGAPAATSDKASDDDDKGTVRLPSRASGHRVYVDGRRAQVDESGTLRLPCGRHVIQIGSQGTPEPIDVRCGGELQLQ